MRDDPSTKTKKSFWHIFDTGWRGTGTERTHHTSTDVLCLSAAVNKHFAPVCRFSRPSDQLEHKRERRLSLWDAETQTLKSFTWNCSHCTALLKHQTPLKKAGILLHRTAECFIHCRLECQCVCVIVWRSELRLYNTGVAQQHKQTH